MLIFVCFCFFFFLFKQCHFVVVIVVFVVIKFHLVGRESKIRFCSHFIHLCHIFYFSSSCSPSLIFVAVILRKNILYLRVYFKLNELVKLNSSKYKRKYFIFFRFAKFIHVGKLCEQHESCRCVVMTAMTESLDDNSNLSKYVKLDAKYFFFQILNVNN